MPSLPDNVYSQTVKVRGEKAVKLHKIRYAENPLETSLWAGDITLLNKDKLDYKDAISGIAKHTYLSVDGVKVYWDMEDRRRKPLVIASVVGPTTFTLTAPAPTNLIPGSVLFNPKTFEQAIVSNVTGATVTVNAPGFVSPLHAPGAEIFDRGYAKAYGIDSGKGSIRNDYEKYENTIQIDERQVPVDMIENNKSYFNITPEERLEEQVSDICRDAMFDGMFARYFGRSRIETVNGNTHYYAGGLDEFILPQNKVIINFGQAHEIRTQVMERVRRAHQSGVPQIYGGAQLTLVCTTKMVELLSLAFGDNITYNEKFNNYHHKLGTIHQNGFELKFVVSSFLDEQQGDYAFGYYYPVKYAGMFCFPHTGQTTDKQGRNLEKYHMSAIYYKKPVTTIEKSTTALWLQYSFMFPYHTTPAYQRWIIA